MEILETIPCNADKLSRSNNFLKFPTDLEQKLKILKTEIEEINSQNFISDNFQKISKRDVTDLNNNSIPNERSREPIYSHINQRNNSGGNINSLNKYKSKVKVLEILAEKERLTKCSFHPKVNTLDKRRDFEEFYDDQMKISERKKKTINEIKRKEEEKFNQVQTFIPRICKESMKIFNQISRGLSLKVSERLYPKNFDELIDSNNIKANPILKDFQSVKNMHSFNNFVETKSNIRNFKSNYKYDRNSMSIKRNESKNKLKDLFPESKEKTQDIKSKLKQIYSSSTNNNIVSFTFTPKLFKSIYSNSKRISSIYGTETKEEKSKIDKSYSLIYNEELDRNAKSIHTLHQSDSLLFLRIKKMFEKNYDAIFNSDKLTSLNYEKFGINKIVMLLKSLKLVLDEKKEKDKILKLFVLIKSNLLLSRKDIIFIHILAILKIKSLDSGYKYKIGSVISSEMLNRFNSIKQYFNYLHKEFIEFYLNYRSNFEDSRKEELVEFSFLPKINHSNIMHSRFQSDGNLKRIEERAVIDQKLLNMKIHKNKITKLYNEISVKRDPEINRGNNSHFTKFISSSKNVAQQNLQKNSKNKFSFDKVVLI